jgi:Tfp pilus assembly PilM family ATPase/Tfp pilus assembly protein PilN
MSKAEAFLASAVQIAGPLTRLQERIVAVKLHPDAVSVMQLNPTLDDWKLDRLISWSLDNAIGRQPVQENYPYLSDQIAAAANEAGVDGVDAGISIPASLFDTRTLTLPFMSKAELAEEAEEPEFWEEFDPELSNLVGRVVKFQILYSNENEDRIVVLLSSIGVADLERYRSLMLDANLLPVFIENEIFSLVNGIYARMSSDDIYKPFSIVHLCPGNNLLVSNMRGRLVTQKINISDFDEALLMELESVDEPGGDFWEEVAIRVSEQVKQAIAFVVETYEFPNPDKVFFVSEYKSIDNFVTLIEDRLGTARVIVYDAMEDVEVPNEHAKYLDYFENPSVFTTAVGLATQGINVEGRGASHLHRSLISMNFLQDAPRIRRNRQLGAVNRILTLAIMAVLVFSGSVLGINTIPAYLQTREASKQFNQAKSVAQAQKLRRAVSERKLLEANALVSNMQKNTVRRGHAKFLAALPAMLPIGTELQGLTISQTDGVALSGLATSNEQVSEIKRNLRTQGFVSRDPAVDLKREDDYWAFQMTLNLARSE